MTFRHPLFTLWLTASIASAEEAKPDLTPAISLAGELLFADDFDKPTINPKWVALHGTQWQIVDGALQGGPSTKDFQQDRVAQGNAKHSGRTPSSRLMVATDDCIVLFRFKLTDGLKGAHFGFNDGTIKTGSGHVCRFTATTNQGMTLQKDRSFKLEDDKDETLVSSTFNLKPDTWHWMMIEVLGDQISAQISGSPTLKARHARVDIPKDQINLPTRGGGTILYDHVRVWKALPPAPTP